MPTPPYDGRRGEIILAQDPNRVLWQIGGIKGVPTKSWMLTDYDGRILSGVESTGVFNRKYDAWLAWKQSELASSAQVSYATHLMAQAVKKGTMNSADVPSKTNLQAMTSKDIGGLISGMVDERGTPTWYGNGSFGGFKASAQRVASRYIQAGTATRTIKGYGMDVHEAWQNAITNDREDYGREYGGENNLRDAGPAKMIKAPKKPTKVTITKRDVTKGPVTKKFVIERRWGFSGEPSPITRDKRYVAQYDTQGTVLAAAKELALQYGEELRISLQAFCHGNTVLADVAPEKGEKGLWAWKVDFRD